MSDRVKCAMEFVDLEGDYGQVEGVRATCSRCDHETTAFGTSGVSVRRCLAQMREECPMDQENFYYADDGSDEI